MARPNFATFRAASGAITTETIRIDRGVKLTWVTAKIVPETGNPDASLAVRAEVVDIEGNGVFALFPTGTIISKTSNSRQVVSWSGEYIIDDFSVDLTIRMNNEHTAAIDVAIDYKFERLDRI